MRAACPSKEMGEWPKKFSAGGLSSQIRGCSGWIYGACPFGRASQMQHLVACSQSLGMPITSELYTYPQCKRMPDATAGFEKRHRSAFGLSRFYPRKRVDLTCRLFEALKIEYAEMDIVGGGSELEVLRPNMAKT